MSDAVLAIKLGALGDVIQAFDAFHDIRAYHRGDRVVLLTTPPFAGLARRMPWFDDVWSDGRPKASEIGALLGLIGRWRRAGFSRVYDLQCNHRTDWYRRLLIGRRRPEWFGAVPGQRNNYDAMRAQLAAAGVPPTRPTDLGWLDADITAFNLPRRFVMFVPSCSPSRPQKRWPPAAYAALGRRVLARGVDIVLVGTGADHDAIAAIAAALPEARNLIGRTDLVQLAAIARRAAGVVGNDTGPVFLTAAVGAPTLMLMSAATDPDRSAPRGARTAWLRRDNLAALGVDEVEHALLIR